MRYSVFLMSSLVIVAIAPERYAVASSDAETTIAECQKRTGMGRESCIGFIKKYMNVERCQEYTKLSASDCEKRLDNLRKSPEFREPSKGGVTSTPPKRALAPSLPTPLTVSSQGTLKERIAEVRRDREERFRIIHNETNKVISFLKAQGRDTVALEQHVDVFVQKQQAVLAAYDQYARLAEADPGKRPSLAEPRKIVAEILTDTLQYYRTTVLSVLRQSLE